VGHYRAANHPQIPGSERSVLDSPGHEKHWSRFSPTAARQHAVRDSPRAKAG